jgi:hypothetical protein
MTAQDQPSALQAQGLLSANVALGQELGRKAGISREEAASALQRFAENLSDAALENARGLQVIVVT